MNSSEVQVLWGQAVNLGANVAAAVVGHAVSAPTWVQTLPLILWPILTIILARFHIHAAQQSYANQLAAGIVQPNGTPVAVGSGPPPAVVGPESEAV